MSECYPDAPTRDFSVIRKQYPGLINDAAEWAEAERPARYRLSNSSLLSVAELVTASSIGISFADSSHKTNPPTLEAFRRLRRLLALQNTSATKVS